ncbi:hypothetical protein O181_037289, partial [Austropuccinia psidii MF-1]|nr:hypothetical protein [Austropuccinia psidii MF-1]
VLKKYIVKIECQTTLQVANIISDNGKEFVNTELQDFFDKRGISHLTTAPYTTEQNPFSERGNRTTITKTRCLLKDLELDLSFCAEAANTAVYLENITPSKNIIFNTPFHKWFNKEPSLRHLQPFGCLAAMLKHKQNGKFDESGSQGIFLGYRETHRLYRIMDPGTETPSPAEEVTPIQPQLPTYKGYLWVLEHESGPQNKIHGDVGNPNNILPYQRQSRHHANLASHFSSDPKTYQEEINGSNSQEWKNAIKVELDNMSSHKVWSPTTPESHVKPLSTTWVYKQKTDKNGDLSKFKARLCVQGFTQREGIDYSEILTEFNTNPIKPPSSPLTCNYKELKSSGEQITGPPPFNYRRAVGLLQYIVQCTRTELSFATSFLSQFLEDPKDLHYKAVTHTLKYLSGTRHFTLNLVKNLLKHPKTQILGFTNLDWGGGTEKKSFSSSLIYFYGVLGWRAHRKKIVAPSSAEAEYNALTESAQDLLWIQQIIFGTTNTETQCIINSDNQSGIAIAANPVYHHGTRHIDF